MQNQSSPERWILFDWNGTLVDDLDLCLEIHQKIRTRAGLPSLSKSDYLDQFGFPLVQFYQKVGFDLVQPSFETITEWFMDEYYQRDAEHQIFEDANRVLRALREQGYKLGILSASRHQRLVDSVSKLGLFPLFDRILGIKDDFASSKADELHELMETEGLKPDQILFVGDTHHDAEIALDKQIPYALILRGHQSRAALEHLPKLLTFNSLDEFYESLITQN